MGYSVVFVINPLTVERKDILIEAALLIARFIHWETIIASLGAMVRSPRGFNIPDFIDFIFS